MKGIFFYVLLFIATFASAAKLELTFWHSLAGDLGQELMQIVEGFNQSQDDYRIKPIYKGEYNETLTSFAAAFKAKQPPSMIQIFEVGTGVMLSPNGIIKPLETLMSESHQPLPIDKFLPALVSFYSKQGKLQALPFNSSIPVFYYNADALKKIGIDKSADFPKTWDELEVVAAQLKAQGYGCAYTSAYPAWIHIEAFSALHGLPFNSESLFDHPGIIKHLQRLKSWQAKHYFEYGGRGSDATVLFTSGRCVMFSQSSGSFMSLKKLVNFNVGIAALPMESSVSKIRHHNVIGGAALWAVAGLSPEHYRGIAAFYTYLLKPEIQQQWVLHTGYIPISLTGHDVMNAPSNLQEILLLAKQDLTNIGFSNSMINDLPQNLIRTIHDEAIEAIFAKIKTPEAAFKEATLRAKYVILRFFRNTAHTPRDIRVS